MIEAVEIDIFKEPKGYSFDEPRPCACGRLIFPIAPSEYSMDLGEPVYNSKCSKCLFKVIENVIVEPVERKFRQWCNRGCGKMVMEGTAWCAPCAIAYNEGLIGQTGADGQTIKAEDVAGFIERFRGFL